AGAVPGRLLGPAAGPAGPGPQPDLPGARPGLPLPGRPLHAPGLGRRGLGGPHRRPGIRPGGLPQARLQARRPRRVGRLPRLPAPGPPLLEDGLEGDLGRSLEARLPGLLPALHPGADGGRSRARSLGGAGPGARPRRAAGGRLHRRDAGPPHPPRPQRAFARCDLVARDRAAGRRQVRRVGPIEAMAFATADGVSLYYEETGSGTPLLFSHEFAGDHRSWAPQVRELGRRYRCITYSARGYPPSDVPDAPEAYSQERAVADAVAVLDHLGIERAHVVGLSMGGFCALHLGLSRPERALSLVVAGCG